VSGAVQLSAPVVGDDDGIGAGIHHCPGVVDVLDAFHDQGVRPGGSQPVQVVENRGGVEHLPDEVGHGAVPVAQ
jgi:hypothetical protein